MKSSQVWALLAFFHIIAWHGLYTAGAGLGAIVVGVIASGSLIFMTLAANDERNAE